MRMNKCGLRGIMVMWNIAACVCVFCVNAVASILDGYDDCGAGFGVGFLSFFW